MSKSLEKLMSVLSLDEQQELEKFALYLLLRRRFSTEQIVTDDISSEELMQLAMQGGGFDWLADEPDIYSPKDGEPIQWPQRHLGNIGKRLQEQLDHCLIKAVGVNDQ